MDEAIKTVLKNKLHHKFNLCFGNSDEKNLKESLKVSEKEDRTLVTDIDLMVSNEVKTILKAHPKYHSYTFFSEEEYTEEEVKKLKFPACIIDPIDGTRELIKGRDECVVSIAFMNSADIHDPKNEAWIYNPFSGVEFSSETQSHSLLSKSAQEALGLVSRSEWHMGLYQGFKSEAFILAPRGSIAFKLGLLSSGAIDFVVTKKPKAVWDIAAGTILAAKRGYKLFQAGHEVVEFSAVKYNGPLLWVSKFHQEELLKHFK